MLELLNNFESCKTRVSYGLVIFCEEHQCRLLRREAWSSFKVSVGITKEGEVVMLTVYLGVRHVNGIGKYLRHHRDMIFLRISRFLTSLSQTFLNNVKPLTSLTERESIMYEWGAEQKRDKIWLTQVRVLVENAPAEMLRDLDQQMEKRADDDAAESVSDAIRFEYCLASSSGWTKSPVIWAEIGGSSLIGPELVQETTDKEVLIKEKLKAARDHQKSYADNRRKPLEFEILERIGLVAYRLRLPKELSAVHDMFHVSNLKKCLADASLHVPLDEIKVDKTLCFVEEPIEIMDREVK
ncbi:hypothetical protein Tco_0353381, partial [Tanacetum coccineum]